MGWARGSGMLEEIWEFLRPRVSIGERVLVFNRLAKIFLDNDCDTLDEIVKDEWPEVELALRDLGWIEDEDEDYGCGCTGI